MLDLSTLNPQQKRAVEHREGPVLVLAGPGSGKTKTLTYRIAYLLSNGVSPQEMLALTFTKKAAREMRERAFMLCEGINVDRKGLTIGTFHSIFASFLRTEALFIGRSKNFVIYDKNDQASLLKIILGSMGVVDETVSPALAASAISQAKSKLMDENDYASRASTLHESILGQVYRRYQARLKEVDALDFDDLIMSFARLLEANSGVLKRYQERFHYFLIDEYQDTNPAQYRALQLLAQLGTLFAVADDWQAIYSFRNADVGNVINFKKDWPNGLIIPLEQNYRSTKTILLAAQRVIEENKFRMEKTLWTENAQGAPIVIKETLDEMREATYVVHTISQRLRTSGNNLDRIAVFFRTNTQARAIEEMLLSHGLPYQTRGLVRFYERKEVKDIVAYLRIVHNPFDNVALARIINTPPRGLGLVSVKQALRFGRLLKDRSITPELQERLPSPASKRALLRFLEFYERLTRAAREYTLEELIGYTVTQSGYDNLLKRFDLAEEKESTIQELRGVASRFLGKARESLPHFLDELSLSFDEDANEGKKGVHLMTVHAAKGLEFPTVFITGLEYGIFPHYKSIASLEDLEEERRLFYVAMTRARRQLFLTYARMRRIYGRVQANPPSNFLDELPAELVVRE